MKCEKYIKLLTLGVLFGFVFSAQAGSENDGFTDKLCVQLSKVMNDITNTATDFIPEEIINRFNSILSKFQGLSLNENQRSDVFSKFRCISAKFSNSFGHIRNKHSQIVNDMKRIEQDLDMIGQARIKIVDDSEKLRDQGETLKSFILQEMYINRVIRRNNLILPKSFFEYTSQQIDDEKNRIKGEGKKLIRELKSLNDRYDELCGKHSRLDNKCKKYINQINQIIKSTKSMRSLCNIWQNFNGAL
ncbi:MAG: hypothetical protein LBH49_00535 [Puniceicoccales bacterium]|jgi:uncharacterized protein YdcH (DUF465 family)|nr:hypothetical protein [Puniceicoccales bacterium]